MSNRTDWEPILKGETASQALHVALDIAHRMREAERHRTKLIDIPQWESRASTLDISHEFSLSSGAAGKALLFAYCDRAWPGCSFDDCSRANLLAAIDGIEALSGRIDLWDGFTGVAWVVDHMSKNFPQIAKDLASDANNEVDEALASILESTENDLSYDLVSGVVGLGIYGLDRGDTGPPRRIAELVLEGLQRTSRRDENGTYWETPGHLAISENPAVFGNGFIDTGMAHGIGGVIAFLARAIRRDVHNALAHELMHSTVGWLAAQRLVNESINRFPAKITPSFQRLSNAAWCYGDPGIAAGLVAASQATRNHTFAEFANELGQRVALFDQARAGIGGSGLCHGSSGLALLFSRLAECTGNHVYTVAARNWYECVLADPCPATDDLLWGEDQAFLSGPGGVALALLAGATNMEPMWDSILMLPHPFAR